MPSQRSGPGVVSPRGSRPVVFSDAPSAEVGAALHQARKAANLYLRDIGGYSVSKLSRAERGLGPIDDAMVRRYAKVTDNPGLETYLVDEHPTARASRYAPEGFVLDNVQATVRVAEDGVSITEHREIRPTRAQLAEIEMGRGLARVGGVQPLVLHLGAVHAHVEAVEWISETYLRVRIAFSFPVPVNVRHRFTLDWQLDRMSPVYTMTPLVRGGAFAVSLQLTTDRPWTVWVFDGVSPTAARDFRDAARHGEAHSLTALDVDRFGSAEVSFQDLVPGLVYGLLWIEGEAGVDLES